jgi:alginate O-acetyltransferase complex protein AlgJ
VDLLPAFLAARAAGNASEPLYQKQDTHWTHGGLALAARLLSERVRRYPWFAELSRHAEPFGTKPASFTRFGDLHSRLPDAEKPKYQPESLLAQQVLRRDGRLYEDDPDSPIVMLGDSYTGVYQLTDAEHAGISAHLAKGVSYPVDLVMSYGGGPNVRNKLLSRGADDLNHKKLVIWLMTARDLYDYWEDWEPLVTK